MPPENPTVNHAVMSHLAARLSYPAKAMTGPVPDDAALEAILSVALRVPDHGKLEPWRLVVIGPEAMKRLADLAEARARELGGEAEKIEKGRGQFDRGRLAVAVISSPKPSEKVPELEQLLSAGALCMNILHAATASGWAANWLTGWVSHDATFAARAFGCTGAERIAGIVHIGTAGAPMPDRPRPDLSRVVTRAGA